MEVVSGLPAMPLPPPLPPSVVLPSLATILPYSVPYLNALVILATIFHVMGISSTAFRVWRRWRINRFWWDDFYALIGALLEIVLFSDLWLRYYYGGHAEAVTRISLRLFAIWSEQLTYTLLVWMARISIAVSIVRMLPECSLRRATVFTAWVFCGACVCLVTFKSYTCGRDAVMQGTWAMTCKFGRAYKIVKITSDVSASLCLVVIPLRMLWNSNLPKVERWMIRAVFMTSLLSACVSIVHVVYLSSTNFLADGYTAHFEAGITLTVSNLLVVTTSLFRYIRHLIHLQRRRRRRNRNRNHNSPNSPSSSTFTDSSDAPPHTRPHTRTYPEHQISRPATSRSHAHPLTRWRHADSGWTTTSRTPDSRLTFTELDTQEMYIEDSVSGGEREVKSLPGSGSSSGSGGGKARWGQGGRSHSDTTHAHARGTQSLGAVVLRPEPAMRKVDLFKTIRPP